MLGLALRRALPLVILLALAGAGYLAWQRVRAAPAASVGAARRYAAGGRAPLPDTVPAPGVYRYAQRGTERLSLGPVRIDRRLPKTALLAVRPGDRSGSVYRWLLASDVTDTVATVPGRDGAARLVGRTIAATLPFASFTLGGSTSPAIYRPGAADTGTLPVATYQLGGIVFRRTASITRRTTLTVAGQPVKVIMIEAKDDLTGKTSGDITERVWWSPDLGLDVRRSVDIVLLGATQHRITSTVELQSVLPVR